MISIESSKNYQDSPDISYLMLDLRSGRTQEPSWQMITPSHGDSLIPNTGARPKIAKESILSHVLEAISGGGGIPSTLKKYCFTPTLAEGALRRARKKHKQIPKLLRLILEARAAGAEFPIEVTGVEERPAYSVMYHAPAAQAYIQPDDTVQTLTATMDNCSAGPLVIQQARKSAYVLRRVTPKECARLQGFPDDWCDDLEQNNTSDREMSFWKQIWNAWDDLRGKKNKSENQIGKWLRSKPTDSAQYKMWGNGVTLQIPAYIMRNIANVS